jgi:hypothetical protein
MIWSLFLNNKKYHKSLARIANMQVSSGTPRAPGQARCFALPIDSFKLRCARCEEKLDKKRGTTVVLLGWSYGTLRSSGCRG